MDFELIKCKDAPHYLKRRDVFFVDLRLPGSTRNIICRVRTIILMSGWQNGKTVFLWDARLFCIVSMEI